MMPVHFRTDATLSFTARVYSKSRELSK